MGVGQRQSSPKEAEAKKAIQDQRAREKAETLARTSVDSAGAIFMTIDNVLPLHPNGGSEIPPAYNCQFLHPIFRRLHSAFSDDMTGRGLHALTMFGGIGNP